ncbi:MAG TPA: NAD(P)H-hydrate epimerase [bacterium]|nr:NAD(P)H-hydrate epimerase [bacterium]
MLPVGRANDARRMDSAAIKRGTPSLLLMENAAFSLYFSVCETTSRFDPDRIVVFAGKGGNGGDGMALLRILADRGCPLPLILVPFFDPKDLSGDPLTNYRLLPKKVSLLKRYSSLSGRILFIDALLGTGISSPLSSDYRKAVDFINNYKDKKVIAVDVPTGLSSDTGMLLPVAIRADVTVSLGILKAGLFLDQGPAYAGELVLGPISAKPVNPPLSLLENEDFLPCPPPIDAHKGKNGRLLVIGGDPSKIGASFIAAEAFLAAGGGLATVAVPEKQLLKLAGRHPAIMLTTTEEALTRLDHWDVVLCGQGLSNMPQKLEKFLYQTPARLILDAGIFDHADDAFFKRFRQKEIVFTPHPGELARVATRINLSGRWDEQVALFPLGPRQVLLAKNASSWIRDKKQTVIVPYGARALSFGGTGDALAGMLASFAARISDLRQAAINAALLHREAGILLETEISPSFHSISTLIEQIGAALCYHEDTERW